MRILYAEDERDLNDLVTHRIVAEGYGVDSCLDGQQAWDYLQAADYDAAILDIMMPHLDGLSVLKKLRAAGKTTPVLLLTARDAIADRVAGLDSGANDYLVKPFALEELSARLRVLTRSQFGAGDSRLVAGDLTLDTGTRNGIKTARLSVVRVRNDSILRTPKGIAVFSPSSCWNLRTPNWQRCFLAVISRASVSLSSCSLVSAV